jgi:hypothetical protein
MALAWDCIAKRWAVYVGPEQVFSDVWKASGVSKEVLEKGDGPDVLLQRMGVRTEVAVCPETVGKPIGNGMLPSMDTIIKQVEKASLWNTFDSTIAVERKYGGETDQND